MWSGSVGLRLRLSELVTFHGGFYVDPSPVKTESTVFSRRPISRGFGAEFLHAQGGALRVDRLGDERGTADTTLAVGGLSVSPLPVELSFTTFNLSFAIGYKF